MFETRSCIVNNVPWIFAFGIVGLTIIFSIFIFHQMLSNFYSPTRTACTVQELRDTFAVHILALADALSDMGFTVTVFFAAGAYFEDKSPEVRFNKEQRIALISDLSVFVIILSQMWVMIGT